MPSSLWSLLIAVPLLVGCGPTFEAVQINRPPHPLRARKPRSVKLFSSPPARPHVDVAVLVVDQASVVDAEDRVEMLREMRDRAAEIGCDGIVLGGRTRHEGTDPTTPLFLVGGSTSSWQGTCIVYDDRERPNGELAARPDSDTAAP